MRRISFSKTKQQVKDQTKTVTRRMRWAIKPGERFLAIEKGQGLRKGQKQVVLAECECVSVWWECLSAIVIGDKVASINRECVREGFPGMSGADFVKMFCKLNKCDGNAIIARVEFKYIEKENLCSPPPVPADSQRSTQPAGNAAPG